MTSITEQWQNIHAEVARFREEPSLAAFHPLLELLQAWAGAESPPYPLPCFATFLALLRRASQERPVPLPAQAFEQTYWIPLLRRLPEEEHVAPDIFETFLEELCNQLRPTRFLEERFPEDFVQRPAEYETLLTLLLGEGDGQTGAITTALRGTGGYGKTTLARALCYDPRVWRAFPDGILWVTLGEGPGDLMVSMRRLINEVAPVGEEGTVAFEYGQVGLPPILLSRLQGTLLRCGPFGSHRELESLFVDARLAPWCNKIPTAESKQARVQALVKWLYEQKSDAGESALLLLLEVLVDNIEEGQGCKQEVHKQANALRQALSGPLNKARAALEKALGSQRLLLVLDDVWVAGHLTPFLARSPHCAYLVTTRDSLTLPPKSERPLIVDAMQPGEAVALLGAGLSAAGHEAALRALAKRLGHWPLLLRLANSQLLEWLRDLDVSVEVALQTVNEDLTSMGLAALEDHNNPDERQRAAAATLRVSLNRLVPTERYGRLTVDERRCYEQLALFPEDVEVPLTVLARLWGLHGAVTRRLCTRFHQLSLLQAYKEMATLRLHNVVRTLLIEAQGGTLPTLHQAFLNACRPASGQWSDLPQEEPYLWQHLAYHLVQAEQRDELRQLLLNLDWIYAKLEATDIRALLADYEVLGDDTDGHLVKGALQRSLHLLARDKRALMSQLYSPLMTQDAPGVLSLLEEMKAWQATPWFRTLTPSMGLVSGELLFILEGHTKPAIGLAVTSDGGRVLSSSDDGTLIVWDLQRGTRLQTLIGHANHVRSVAILDNDRKAISASDDRTLKLWNLEDGSELRTLKGHNSIVRAVAVLWDGQRVISASNDHTLKVWDLETGAVLHTLTGHTDYVVDVAVLPDGRHVVSASDDGTLKLWDLENPGSGAVRTFKGHEGMVRAVAISPDGRRIISASDDYTLRVWDTQSAHELRKLEGHKGTIWAVAVTPDGRRIISGSIDQTLKGWDLDTGLEQWTIPAHTDWVRAVAITPDGRYLISASGDRTVKVWDLENYREPDALTRHTAKVEAVAITPDGRFVISASNDCTLKVWDVQQGIEQHTLGAHRGPVRAVALSPDGKRAISASDDHTLKLWDLERGTESRTFLGHTAAVRAVAVTPDGQYAISVSDDHTLKMWDLERGNVVADFVGETEMVSCSLSADGKIVVVGEKLGRVHILQLEGLLGSL